MLDKVHDEIYFHTFLKTRRETIDATLESVSNGICSKSTVLRMEQDEMVPEKMIRNRIAARLGISGEKYEDYLPPKEYNRWRFRQDILKSIERKQFLRAEKQLAKYAERAPKKSVERQFVAAMKFQILQMKKAPLYRQRAMIEKAVKETIQMKGDTFPENLLLAEQEINLLIEYVSLHGTGSKQEIFEWRLQEYKKIITYIENANMDNAGKVKIYPKVVYYWVKLKHDYYMKYAWEFPKEMVEECLALCENAIGLLRDTMKLFYFVEIIELYQVFCCEKLKSVFGKEAKEWNQYIGTIISWRGVIKNLYREYGLSPYMQHFCHLYWEMQSYPMGEVIRIRRKMMKMTKEELSDETCDLKSVTRCEKDRVKTQKYTIRGLFPKIGLGMENICAGVVTNDYEALEMYNDITRYANIGDLENWEKSLKELEQKLNLEIPENKQTIEMSYHMLLWCKKLISDEELQLSGKHTLENTITLENIIYSNKWYLTQKELYCAYRSAIGTEKKEQEQYLSILKEIFEKYEQEDCITPYIQEYEFIMTEISSWLGNMGNYLESNELSKHVIRECLVHRRMGMLGANRYHILWNHQQINGEEMIRDKELLEESMRLCEIARNKKGAIFLHEKIVMLE